jgi:hypothetical protein
MATPITPAMMQSGPPAQPPEMPTLSAAPQGDGGDGTPMPGQIGSLPEVFFGVEQELKLLAKMLPPGLAAELEPVSQQLRAVLVKALQSGAAPQSQEPMPTSGGTPAFAGPVGGRPDTL